MRLRKGDENAKIWRKLPKKEGAREWFIREIRCEKGVNWCELGGEKAETEGVRTWKGSVMEKREIVKKERNH